MPRKKRAVLVICDGHRNDLVQPDLCPEIFGLTAKGQRFLRHTAVFPSVTRASSATIATGHLPSGHGLHGNKMGLSGPDGIGILDVGKPEFVRQMRCALGRTLKVPTLAERFAAAGGSVVFSNVSPGAAYFQDPDAWGHVYHRAGSYGPNHGPVSDPLTVTGTVDGDREMTDRFCREILLQRRPALSVLWLANPDKTLHGCALGSPQHIETLQRIDECVGQVALTVDQLNREGEDVLLLTGSDHGMETVRRVIAVETELFQAGFKSALDSKDMQVAPQGTSALIYVHSASSDQMVEDAANWLRAQDWTASVVYDRGLEDAGLRAEGGLRIAVSMARDDEPNAFGIPGRCDAAVRFDTSTETPGFGQHGGLGTYETHPFLVAIGSGFEPGSRYAGRTSLTNIAPTVLHHFGQVAHDLPDPALQTFNLELMDA